MTLSMLVHSPEEMAILAARFGSTLRAGDCILLDGPVGAGKTHFTRSLIQAHQDHAEDVPSPTFTLVQVYETAVGEIWHADLYRIGSIDEIEELGLVEAMTDAISIIEWPDRLGELAPHDALSLTFDLVDDMPEHRQITLQGDETRWARLRHILSDDR